MKRKSIMALGLAAVLAMGTCVPVLAADLSGTDTAPASGSTTVSAEQSVAFTVDIPSTVELNATAEKELTVTLSGDGLMLEKEGKVSISSSSITENQLTLNAGGDTLKVGVTEPATKDLSAGGTWVYKFAKPTFVNAGNYTATMDFTIAYGKDVTP